MILKSKNKGVKHPPNCNNQKTIKTPQKNIMTKDKMYQVECPQISVVFEDNLTLAEANEYVRISEEIDKDNEEYFPNFYLITEMQMYQVESALSGRLLEKNLTIQEANNYVQLSEQKDTENECFVANFYRITHMNFED